MPAVFVDSFGGMDYPRFRAADSVFLFLRGYDGDTSSFSSGTNIIEFELSNISDYANSRVLMTIQHGGEINVRWYNSVSEVEIVLTTTYSARLPHNIGFWADDTGSYLLLDGDQVATGGALTYLGGLWDKTKVLARKETVTPAVDRFRVAHIQTVAAYSGLTLAEAQALTVEGDEPTSPRYPATLPAVLRNTKSRNQPAPYRVLTPRRSHGYTRYIGSDTPVFWDVQWRFTRAQAYDFIQWFENDLKRGALPFVMSLKTEFGMIEHACRFLPDSLLPASDTGESWDYSASIMSRGEIIPALFIDNADAIIAKENWDGTIPGDPYWSSVARLVQFGDSETGAAFKDWKTNTAGTLYTDGTVQEGLVTRTNMHTLGGGSSMRWTYQASAGFANRILTLPASSVHAIPAGQDFTVEAWIRGNRATTDNQGWMTIMRSYTTTTAANAADWELVLQAGTSGPGGVNSFLPGFVINNEILIRADGIVGVNNAQWHHVAVSRRGTSWRVFVNGISTAVVTPQGSPGSFNGSFGSASSKLSLMGREDNSGGGLPNCYGFGIGDVAGANDAYDGYLGAARITVGVARYWDNFIPVEAAMQAGPLITVDPAPPPVAPINPATDPRTALMWDANLAMNAANYTSSYSLQARDFPPPAQNTLSSPLLHSDSSVWVGRETSSAFAGNQAITLRLRQGQGGHWASESSPTNRAELHGPVNTTGGFDENGGTYWLAYEFSVDDDIITNTGAQSSGSRNIIAIGGLHSQNWTSFPASSGQDSMRLWIKGRTLAWGHAAPGSGNWRRCDVRTTPLNTTFSTDEYAGSDFGSPREWLLADLNVGERMRVIAKVTLSSTSANSPKTEIWTQQGAGGLIKRVSYSGPNTFSSGIRYYKWGQYAWEVGSGWWGNKNTRTIRARSVLMMRDGVSSGHPAINENSIKLWLDR